MRRLKPVGLAFCGILALIDDVSYWRSMSNVQGECIALRDDGYMTLAIRALRNETL